MTIKIYLSNLAKYVSGEENGRWLQLPMETSQLNKIFTQIVGEGQEGIILDYNAPFDISEYENIFSLNDFMEDVKTLGFDVTILTALFELNPNRTEVMEKIKDGSFTLINVNEVSKGWSCSLNRNELLGLVLNETGYNNLFPTAIPQEMIDYMDFEKIYTCLSVNDGWDAIDVGNITYLVKM